MPKWPALACFTAIACAASLDVPYVHQQKQGCGPASVAMVMQYWEHQGARFSEGAATPATVYRALYRPDLHGASSTEMAAYLRANSFAAFEIDGEWKDLNGNLSRGRPVVVSLRPSEKAPFHYVVVVGVEDSQVVVHDPARRADVAIPAEQFQKEWRRSGNWALIAAPEQIP